LVSQKKEVNMLSIMSLKSLTNLLYFSVEDLSLLWEVCCFSRLCRR